MILLIFIQLSLFFIMTAVGLWLDQLFNGTFGPKARLVGLYKAGGIIAVLTVIPWLILVSHSSGNRESYSFSLRVGLLFAANGGNLCWFS
jgi:hypothetical protein